MRLLERTCRPCPPGTAALERATFEPLLEQIPAWGVTGGRLARTIRFASFLEAIRFVDKLATLAEDEQHHPDLHVLYDRVEIVLWTHTVGGLSHNDFIVAAKVDALLDHFDLGR